jgi:mono/diheme cytochrome c family protein
MRAGLWIGVALGAAAVGAVGWWLLMPPQIAIRAEDPNVVARGRAVYDQHCASCHGARFEGQENWQTRRADGKLPAPPHDASGHTWHHPDRVLFEITKYGIARYAPPGYASDMPGYEGVLSDTDIAASLAYIKSAWPPEIRAAQERISRQGGG